MPPRRRNPVTLRPGLIFLLGLIGTVLVGSLLLLLPEAVPRDKPLAPVDALFTAASAVCVTGLIVRDTATAFTPFGQTIIMVLIQIGGIGIMTVTGTVSLMMGRGIGIREASMVRDVFEGQVLREARTILKFVTLTTLSVELVGATSIWLSLGHAYADPLLRARFALFHAVSAYCNAGFSTWSDSLMSHAGNGLLVSTVGSLLVLGGLGFTVLANIGGWLWGRSLRRGVRRPRLFLQARVVLFMTALLLAAGTVLLCVFDWHGALGGHSPGAKVALAAFQSATTRTAGFNTMDLTLLSPASLLVMILLMFIGAAPGSTGGGIKLTTVAVLWADARAIAEGGHVPRLFDRELGLMTVRRAFMVATTYTMTAMTGLCILLVTEGHGFVETLFEVVSAMGTVGLSLGLTPQLTVFGRLLVTLLMILGRAGPLVVAYGLVIPTRERGVRWPEGTLLVG